MKSIAIHALDWYEAEKGAVDGLLLLQPTSPYRIDEIVCRGIELFNVKGQQSVLGISPTHVHPMRTVKMEGDYLGPFMPDHGLATHLQDLPAAYVVNGSFYLAPPRNCELTDLFLG